MTCYNCPVGSFSLGVLVLDEPGVPLAPLASSLRELAEWTEEAGATSLFLELPARVNDDPSRATLPMRSGLDAFVALGALGGEEAELGLGCSAPASGGVPPSLLAKYLSGLDLCCGGRAQMVLRSGEPDGPRELLESYEVVSRLLTEASVSFSGATIELSSAWNEPRGPRRVPLGLLLRDRAELDVLGHVGHELDMVLLEGGLEPEDARIALARRGKPMPELLGVVRELHPELAAVAAKRWVRAGCDGVICALPAMLPRDLVDELLALVLAAGS